MRRVVCGRGAGRRPRLGLAGGAAMSGLGARAALFRRGSRGRRLLGVDRHQRAQVGCGGELPWGDRCDGAGRRVQDPVRPRGRCAVARTSWLDDGDRADHRCHDEDRDGERPNAQSLTSTHRLRDASAAGDANLPDVRCQVGRSAWSYGCGLSDWLRVLEAELELDLVQFVVCEAVWRSRRCGAASRCRVVRGGAAVAVQDVVSGPGPGTLAVLGLADDVVDEAGPQARIDRRRPVRLGRAGARACCSRVFGAERATRGELVVRSLDGGGVVVPCTPHPHNVSS